MQLNSPSYEALKEPRGFIKCFQFFLAIFAFATICNFQSSFEVKVACTSSSDTISMKIPIFYPFTLDRATHTACDITAQVAASFSSDARFFVFTGVVSMILSAAVLVLYTFFDEKYQSTPRLVIADFLIAVVLSTCWIAGASAWANGLVGMSKATDAQVFIDSHGASALCRKPGVKCTPGEAAVLTGLTISVLAGFMNFILWAGNLWFLYKETPWFKPKADPSGPPST